MKITEITEAPYSFAQKAADTVKGLNPFSKNMRQSADANRALGDFKNKIKRDFNEFAKLSKQAPTPELLQQWLQQNYPLQGAKKSEPQATPVQQKAQPAPQQKTTQQPQAQQQKTTQQPNNQQGTNAQQASNVVGTYKGKPVVRSKNGNLAIAGVDGKATVNTVKPDQLDKAPGAKDPAAQKIAKQADNVVQFKKKQQQKIPTIKAGMYENSQLDAIIDKHVTTMYKGGQVTIDPKDPENLKHVAKGVKQGASAVDSAVSKAKELHKKGGLDQDLSKSGDKNKDGDRSDDQGVKQGLNRLRTGLGIKNPQLALSGIQKIRNDQLVSAKEREEMKPIMDFMANALQNDPGRLVQMMQKYNK